MLFLDERKNCSHCGGGASIESMSSTAKKWLTVKLGPVDHGSMGSCHARKVFSGQVPVCVLAAVCNWNKDFAAEFSGVPYFRDSAALVRSGAANAVFICRPHSSHAAIGIAALEADLHVLVEKPIAVEKAEALKLLAAHRRPGQVFAAMFNQRTAGNNTSESSRISRTPSLAGRHCCRPQQRASTRWSWQMRSCFPVSKTPPWNFPCRPPATPNCWPASKPPPEKQKI
jgi:hypothetical protein